jgi:hypothetical protein
MKRGRPKGYSPYVEIKYEDLADWVGRKTKVPVPRKWLQALMGEEIEEDENTLDNAPKNEHTEEIVPKIKYTLTKF